LPAFKAQRRAEKQLLVMRVGWRRAQPPASRAVRWARPPASRAKRCRAWPLATLAQPLALLAGRAARGSAAKVPGACAVGSRRCWPCGSAELRQTRPQAEHARAPREGAAGLQACERRWVRGDAGPAGRAW
jgi:hypothetical protein